MEKELVYYPDPVLKEACDPVEDPDRWSDLIERMETLLYEHRGIGLAAPQIGESVQIFLLRLDPEEKVHETYINPEIHETRNPETIPEGCLSFPDVTVEIERGTTVNFSATTPGGKEVERTLEGLQAQCVQHEVDHLRGRTLVDHCDLSQKMEIDRALKQNETPAGESGE
jgi:peptide deformylase